MKHPVVNIDAHPAVASLEDNQRVPILMVDDDASKRFALKAVLAPLGYNIVEADSGIAALRCVIAQDFAVILMDVRMPAMDGFETAQLMRQRQRSELTPVIFITGYGNEEEANSSAYDSGAADFIYSPVPPKQLRAKVAMFANLYLRAEYLAEQARKVQQTSDWLALLTDSAPIGIFRTDTEQNYVYVNPRWTEITGISADDALGRPWDIIIGAASEQESAGAAAPESASVSLELPSSHRFEVARDESSPRVVEGAAKPLFGIDNTPAGWVGTLSDVTDEVAAKAEMSAARDAAVAANLMQGNFAASASHELKTPTASILGFIEEVLHSNALAEDDRQALEIAHRNARRLSKLIDDLLIVGEADIGAARMSSEEVALVPIVRMVIASFSATAQAVGVTLVPGDLDEAGVSALGDPGRIEQVMTNLVSNAIKFTPEGGSVTVSVGAFGDTVSISVTDTGIGIDAAVIERIFDRFFRTKAAIDGRVRGSGLGLAIAQRMIEAQNGELTASSVLGEGSTFTMTLPGAPFTQRGSAE